MDTLVGEERKQREAEINRLDNNIKTLDKIMKSEFKNVREEFSGMLDVETNARIQQINNLTEWTKANFDAQREEYQSIAKNLEQEIQVNRNAIRDIYQKVDTNREAANDYITDLNNLVQKKYEISETNFERFAPGEIQKIFRRINTSVEELNGGREQTARSEAINAYEDWMDLQEKVERKKREFDFWHDEAMKQVLELFELVSQYRNEPHKMHGEKEIDVNGKYELHEIDAEVELDYWTNGEFLELDDAIRVERRKLENIGSLSLEDIKKSLARIEELRKREESIVKRAEERVIASQLRAEMADVIVEAMEEEGYTLVNAGYEKSDQRSAYLVNLKNVGGADIVVTIFPSEEDVISNLINIQLKNEESPFSEEETSGILRDIGTIFNEVGINVGRFECMGEDKINEAFYDFDKIFDKNGGLPKSATDEVGARGAFGMGRN